MSQAGGQARSAQGGKRVALTSLRTAGTGGNGEQARLERVLPFASLPTTACTGGRLLPAPATPPYISPPFPPTPLGLCGGQRRPRPYLIRSRLTLVSPLPRPCPRARQGVWNKKVSGPTGSVKSWVNTGEKAEARRGRTAARRAAPGAGRGPMSAWPGKAHASTPHRQKAAPCHLTGTDSSPEKRDVSKGWEVL